MSSPAPPSSSDSTNKTKIPASGPCGNCGKENATKRCSRCNRIHYCSVDCQKAHWKVHKKICNDEYQAQQYELHKQEFDRIIKKYGLDTEQRSTEISEVLTSGQSVSAPEFAEKFGMKVEEAVVFLEWIQVGVKFKEQSIDAAKKSGFSGSS